MQNQLDDQKRPDNEPTGSSITLPERPDNEPTGSLITLPKSHFIDIKEMDSIMGKMWFAIFFYGIGGTFCVEALKLVNNIGSEFYLNILYAIVSLIAGTVIRNIIIKNKKKELEEESIPLSRSMYINLISSKPNVRDTKGYRRSTST